MHRSRPAGRRLRTVALLALGAFAVHQGTYLLGAAAGMHAVGAGHRHGYLVELAPVLIGATLAAILVSLFASAIGRGLASPLQPRCATERAAIYAAALLSAYLCQELVEGLLTGGGSVVEATLGGGASLALPLAFAIGAVAAGIAGALDRTEVRIALAFRPPARRVSPRAPLPGGAPLRILAARPLAFGLSRRPPPVGLAG
jgi:hypothetical protein